MKFLKATFRILKSGNHVGSGSSYVTGINAVNGYTIDIIIPWHARLYRIARYKYHLRTSSATIIPMVTGSVSNMGDVPINNGYEGMNELAYEGEFYEYANTAVCNDFPNTTVYNSATTGGYVNRFRFDFYDFNGTAVNYDTEDELLLIYCFDDDDPTYDDMLNNFSFSEDIEPVTEDWTPTKRGYQHWWIKNGNTTLPYLKNWQRIYNPYKIYIGDEPVENIYRGSTQINTVYVGNTKL